MLFLCEEIRRKDAYKIIHLLKHIKLMKVENHGSSQNSVNKVKKIVKSNTCDPQTVMTQS